jgi:hypothetical protein
MSEAHFDFLAQLRRVFEGRRFLQLTHMLTFGFVEIARHDALYALGAALFKSASTTVFRAGAIGHGAVLWLQESAIYH